MKCTIQGADDLNEEQIYWIRDKAKQILHSYYEQYPNSHINEVRLVVRDGGEA